MVIVVAIGLNRPRFIRVLISSGTSLGPLEAVARESTRSSTGSSCIPISISSWTNELLSIWLPTVISGPGPWIGEHLSNYLWRPALNGKPTFEGRSWPQDAQSNRRRRSAL
jgi:hypothetical protein